MNEPELPRQQLEEMEALATDIARRAGAMTLDYFEQKVAVEFKSKGRTDPVTAADRGSEELLCEAIKKAYPQHAILGEEGTDYALSPHPDVVWVLDPLDGTANFAGGLPLFAVSVGVLHHLRPVAGALFASVSHRRRPGVFHAHLGGGAFFDEERLSMLSSLDPKSVKLTVSLGRELRRAYSRLSKEGVRLEVRSLGSIALEMALVAAGVLRGAAFHAPRLWDVAAGTLLVREVGGVARTRSKEAAWRPLEEFEVKNQPPATPMEALRKWSAPVLVGHRDVIEPLTAAARRPRFGILPLPGFFR